MPCEASAFNLVAPFADPVVGQVLDHAREEYLFMSVTIASHFKAVLLAMQG